MLQSSGVVPEPVEVVVDPVGVDPVGVVLLSELVVVVESLPVELLVVPLAPPSPAKRRSSHS